MARQCSRAPILRSGLLLLLLLLPGIGFSADPLFFPPSYIDMPGEQVFDIAVSDFDGVGGLDVAAVSYEGDSLSILLAGEHGFIAPQSHWAGDGPTSLVCADFNGDLHCDLATCAWDDSLRVFLGQGDGGFVAGPVYATAENPWELATADLNADGVPDLVCSHVGASVFKAFIGDGSGHFTGVEHATNGGQRGLVLAQMDGMNGPDVVLAVFATDQVAVHLNNGAGGFMPPVSYTTADKPYDLEAVDIDLNGIDDLLLIHKDNARQIWGIPGLGMGYLGPPFIFNADYDMDQALLADLDDDDDLDLLVTCSANGYVGVLMQPNDGNWGDPFFQEGGWGAYAPAAGDFDDDGDVDVMVSSYWTNQLALLDNRTYFVPVSVSGFAADVTAGRVELNWQGAGDGEAFEFRLLAAAPDGEFDRSLAVTEILPGRWRAEDVDAALWTGGEFRYRLLSREGDGEWLQQRVLAVHVPAAAPPTPRLLEPWPNPANPRVRLSFLMPEPGLAELSIYDARGRRVAQVARGEFDLGRHEFDWDGSSLPSGVYLVGLRTIGRMESERIVLLK